MLNTWCIVESFDWFIVFVNTQNIFVKSIKYFTCDHSVSNNFKYSTSCLSWYIDNAFLKASALINIWHVESQRVLTFWKSLKTWAFWLFCFFIISRWILKKFFFRRLLLLIYIERARIWTHCINFEKLINKYIKIYLLSLI